MNASIDARYRLGLAQKSLELAATELGASRWREAALFGRGTIEHAIKAIVACFGTIPRSHEPGTLLDGCLSDPRFPTALQPRAITLRPELDRYGMAEHILLSYGDETAHVDPWTLVTEARAREAVRVAEAAVALATDCVGIVHP